jgi:hypothetical protein
MEMGEFEIKSRRHGKEAVAARAVRLLGNQVTRGFFAVGLFGHFDAVDAGSPHPLATQRVPWVTASPLEDGLTTSTKSGVKCARPAAFGSELDF